jgi:hypothetical protein
MGILNYKFTFSNETRVSFINIKEAFESQKQFVYSRLRLSEKDLDTILTLQNGISHHVGHGTSYVCGGIRIRCKEATFEYIRFQASCVSYEIT